MRAVTGWAFALVVLSVVAGGCAQPRLASRPLTEEQMEWTSIIRASYPGWRPPYFSTAVSRDPDLVPVGSASGAAEAVPASPTGDVEFVPAEPSR